MKSPYVGFELSTALFGYYSEISNNISVKLIYDVTRTTSDISVVDSSGTPMNVFYFEGSNYTAFLKQAEINWEFSKGYELSVGQLLNQQYLTVQDKFWGYRFVAVSLQEMYRLGNPADFGIRFTRSFTKKIAVSIGSLNGEGPFRKQDTNSDLLFFINTEYRPENFILKWYLDYNMIDVLHNSFFVAYKKNRYRIGVEYARIDSSDYTITANATEAFAMYSSMPFFKNVDFFSRADFLKNIPRYGIKDAYKLYCGINYKKSTFNTSLNIRFYSLDKSLIFYWQFGVIF